MLHRPLLLLALYASILFSSSATLYADDFEILMIGNSYTQGVAGPGGTSNDVAGIFAADPNHTASVTERAFGGATLQAHASDPLTLDLIMDSASHQWDVVVLQEQSTRPALAMKFGGSELAALDAGAPVLIDLIKQHQPQAQVVLFNTWARYPGNGALVSNFNNDPVEMLGYLNLGYNRILANLPAWDHSDVATIARVGDAFRGWYLEYPYGGPGALHNPDGTHQNNRGSYLAAAVIFETITGKSSVGNSYLGSYEGGVSGMLGGMSTLTQLQERASATTGVAALPALSPGDVAVIGIHGDGTSTSAAGEGDAFSWLPLVDLSEGQVLYFSDVGYFPFKAASGGFGSDSGEEGLFRFTVPAGGIPAGTVQTVDPMSLLAAEYQLVLGNAYTPDLAQLWMNLSGGGDQVVIFQDDDLYQAGFNPLFAATTSTTDWSSVVDGDPGDPDNGGSGSESDLYPGLTDGVNAVAVGAGAGSLDEVDNARYVGPTAGTRSALLAEIANVANWERTNTDQSAGGGGVGSGAWTTGAVAQFSVSPDPVGTSYCVSSPNDVTPMGGTTGALIDAAGSASVSAGDLVLSCGPIGPGQPGIFFFSDTAAASPTGVPFGEGRRCAVGSLVRLLPPSFAALGTLTRAVDYAALPPGVSITPGDTFFFQGWYRDNFDNSGDMVASGFNLSDGLEITFLP